MKLIEPTPQNVRDAIEEVKNPEVQMWLKCLLTFGARSVEFAGLNCSDEKAYGTVGTGYTWITEYTPPVLSDEERRERMNQITSNQNMNAGQAILLFNQPPTPFKVAVFKIPIAKKKRLPGELILHRHAAIPLDKKYEPWAEQIYNYYQQRGKELLFVNNRKHYLDYMRTRKIFENFAYPVERYTIRTVLGQLETVPEDIEVKSAKGNTIYRNYKKDEETGAIKQYDTTPQHYKNGKQHFLRHERTRELNNDYKFNTLALCSFIGWAPARGPEVMIARYGNIYENWGSYIGNLFKVR